MAKIEPRLSSVIVTTESSLPDKKLSFTLSFVDFVKKKKVRECAQLYSTIINLTCNYVFILLEFSVASQRFFFI